ncbi:MAG: hypothetical protein WBB01_10485 [Phormidesmis sp.]
MKIKLQYLVSIAAFAVGGGLMLPAQAQTMQNGQTQMPATQADQNQTDRIGIDASDPYSEQVYSGSQETMNNGQMNNSETMQNGQTTRTTQTPAQNESNQTDRIGIDASDPYSEQVYSGSQDPDSGSQDPMANEPTNSRGLETSAMSQQDGQSLSRLQQRRYEVLDRSSS